ncbi:MAG: hypothetical protein JOZ81_27005 [Chloroflexi bacterium]|nr:hypothetical protein [Chloroflexota bacterium]MBV9544516.1 hypothetical protein [Chloroflexota bacterium]
MHNSLRVPLGALAAAVVLAVVTGLTVMARVGGDPALTELQIGATAWSLALGLFGLQGIVSVVVEGRQLAPSTIQPHLSNWVSAAITVLSVVLFGLAGGTGLAIVSGQPTALIGSAAGAGCLVLGLLLLFYKEAFVGHEAHLEPRYDGVPW